MSKHIPERTCIVCRKKSDKENFVKIVKNKSGQIAIERDEKLDGRGAYICKSKECLMSARKSKALSRVFKTQIDEQIYGELENELK